MGTVTERKVIDLGRGSLIMTLPKAWCRFHGLQAGDTVQAVTDGVLTVLPMPRGAPRRKGRESEVDPT